MFEKHKNNPNAGPEAEQQFNQFMAGQPGSPEADRVAERIAAESVGEKLGRAVHSVGRVAVETAGSLKRKAFPGEGSKETTEFMAGQPGTPEAEAVAKKIARNEKIAESFVRVATATGKVILKTSGWGKAMNKNALARDIAVEDEVYVNTFGGGIIGRTPGELKPMLGVPKITERHIRQIMGEGKHDTGKVGQWDVKEDIHDKRWYHRKRDPEFANEHYKRGNIAAFRRPWKMAKYERQSIKEENKRIAAANEGLAPADRQPLEKVPTRRETIGTAMTNLWDTFPAFLGSRWAPSTYLKHNKQTGHVAKVRSTLVDLLRGDADVKAFLEVKNNYSVLGPTSPLFSQKEMREPFTMKRSGSQTVGDSTRNKFAGPEYNKLALTRVELMRAVERSMGRSWLSTKAHSLLERAGVITPFDELVQREIEHQVELAELEAEFDRDPEALARRDAALERYKMELSDLTMAGLTEEEAYDASVRKNQVWNLQQEQLAELASKKAAREARAKKAARDKAERDADEGTDTLVGEASEAAEGTETTTENDDKKKVHRNRGSGKGDARTKQAEKIARFESAKERFNEVIGNLDYIEAEMSFATTTEERKEELRREARTYALELRDLGITLVRVNVGDTFDPRIHEAIEVTGSGNNEVISKRINSGYAFEDMLLRPARVEVEKR